MRGQMKKAELKNLLDKNKDGKLTLEDALEMLDNEAKAAFWLGLTSGVLAGAFVAFILAIIF